MRFWIIRAIVVILVALLGLGAYRILSRPMVPDTTAGAVQVCEEYVRGRLKAPATAVFAPRDQTSVLAINDSRTKVASYVDSQNSFGANIRTHYTCSVWSAEPGKMRVESLDTTP